MQQANPFRRGVLDMETVFAAGAGVYSEGRRVWYATCPECLKKVMHPSSGSYSRGTRKNTRDALYRHSQQEHRPGLVGR
jgi:hypothetical protein